MTERTGVAMYHCPNCQYQIQDFEQLCPACDLDVAQFGMLNEIPDRLFNEALRALGQNDYITASTKCNAALHQRPKDPELWMLLGIVYSRMAAFISAQQCFQTVAYFDSSYKPAKEYLSRVNALIESNRANS